MEGSRDKNTVMEHQDGLAAFAKLLSDLNYRPPCECNVCLTQYRSHDSQDCILYVYLGHLDATEASNLATKYIDSISEDRRFLLQSITTFGDGILKRWRRRTPRKRKELLAQVDPEIYRTNTPLIDLATRLAGKTMGEQEKYRTAYLLPYLNLQCLSEEWSNLINLLHYRATSRPEEWVVFDNAQIQSAWHQSALREKSADGCITMNGDRYGKWQAFDHQRVHSGYAYGAPRALLILEAQQQLLRFLRKFTAVILRDSSLENSVSFEPRLLLTNSSPDIETQACSKWTESIRTHSQAFASKPWTSLGSIYASQPFYSPPKFDIDSITEIAENQACEAHDELWLLQTDPAYFYERAKYQEASWHQGIPKLDTVRKPTHTESYSNICFIMTIKVLLRARNWQWLFEECRHVKAILDQHAKEIRLDKPLPARCNFALCSLHIMLRQNREYHKLNLFKALQRSRTFNSMFKLTHVAVPNATTFGYGFDIRDEGTLYKRNRTGWCLWQLRGDPKDPFTFPFELVLQHLEDHLHSRPREEFDRVDQEMYKIISDLAAVEKTMMLVKYHRPIFTISHTDGSTSDTCNFDRQAWRVFVPEKTKPDITTCTSIGLGTTIFPLDQFRMPKGPKNEEWLTKSDRVRKSLRTLWAVARGGYQAMLASKDIAQAFIEPQLEQMKQGETPAHLQQIEVEKQKILESLNAARLRVLPKPKEDTVPQFGTSTDSPPARYIPQPPKEKTKTRPSDISSVSELPLVSEEPDKPSPVLYQLQPNSMAYRLASLLFPDGDDDPNKGGADWVEFVTAMTEYGFRAEPRGGSVFTFKGMVKVAETPAETCLRSINFHRPHPSTELSPITLRGMGRRLNRRFGWQRENFQTTDVV